MYVCISGHVDQKAIRTLSRDISQQENRYVKCRKTYGMDDEGCAGVKRERERENKAVILWGSDGNRGMRQSLFP